MADAEDVRREAENADRAAALVQAAAEQGALDAGSPLSGDKAKQRKDDTAMNVPYGGSGAAGSRSPLRGVDKYGEAGEGDGGI